jgi:hypothetical protein
MYVVEVWEVTYMKHVGGGKNRMIKSDIKFKLPDEILELLPAG